MIICQLDRLKVIDTYGFLERVLQKKVFGFPRKDLDRAFVKRCQRSSDCVDANKYEWTNAYVRVDSLFTSVYSSRCRSNATETLFETLRMRRRIHFSSNTGVEYHLTWQAEGRTKHEFSGAASNIPFGRITQTKKDGRKAFRPSYIR